MRHVNLDDIKEKVYPILKKANVKRASFFGSYVRGDNTEESDIDILVDLPRGKTLLDLVGIKQEIEEKIEKKVDVMTYNSIHPLLKDLILHEQYQIL